LTVKFPRKWIGRGGPVTSPPCSPDLVHHLISSSGDI
jgi:hypothetical protein